MPGPAAVPLDWRALVNSLLIFQLAETMGGTNNPTVSKAKKQSRTACGKGSQETSLRWKLEGRWGIILFFRPLYLVNSI